MARSDRIQLWSHFRLPAPILPLMLAILPVLLAILAPTCPTSALKMPEKCHLGANIAKQMLQPPLLAPQNTKNLCFPYDFVGFLLSSPCAKIVSKCSQHAPKTSQVEPKIANFALSWPSWSQLAANLALTSPILRQSSRQPAENLSENRAQNAKRCPEISQEVLQD